VIINRYVYSIGKEIKSKLPF